MSINWKSPKAIGLAVLVFGALYILTTQSVKLTASTLDSFFAGKGYGAQLKSLFGMA